jgi:hypothetical protein
VEAYELLALHLEHTLGVGTVQEQTEAAQNIADLYVALLAKADANTRNRILQNAKSLIERAPEVGTTNLRLQLLRATYLASEQVIEQYRFRIVSTQEHTQAVAQMREVHASLSSIRPPLMELVRTSRGGGSQHRVQNAGLCTSLLAWSSYYLARHDKDAEHAAKASLLFAELLQANAASLQEVATDLASTEFGARAMLGIALCKVVQQDPAGPDPWFELLEQDTVWADVRRQIPLWKLHVLVDRKQWGALLELLEIDTAQGGLRDYWLLLIATRALEETNDVQADLVSSRTIEALIQIGQLSMVSRLYEQYGQRVLEQTNFVGKYVAADHAFRKARELWPQTTPSTDSEVQAQFSDIAALLQEAIEADDAATFSRAKTDCTFLLAHSLYQATEYEKAAEVFYRCAEGARFEDALWMTIVCLDHIHERSVEQTQLRDLAIEQYSIAFPRSERTATLTVHRSFDENHADGTIHELRAIARNDPMYPIAQRRIADLLYQNWRGATQDSKKESGLMYLEIAGRLLHEDDQDLDVQPEAILKRGRRILSVALHSSIGNAQRAKDVLLLLERYEVSEQSVQEELVYRKIQVLILEDALQEAIVASHQLLEEAPNSAWNDSAAVAMINTLRGSTQAIRDSLQAHYFELVIQYLERMDPAALAQPALLHVSLDLLETGLTLWETTNDDRIGERLYAIATSMLDLFPKNQELLYLAAHVAQRRELTQEAISHWRTLSNGLPRGTLDWFESRYHLINLISRDDTALAKKLLQQHIMLYPHYGIPPYDIEFQNLERSLGLELQE